MTDKREDILARLLEVCTAVDGVLKAARNVDATTETSRPAIVILDGDEAAVESDPIARPANAPRRIEMTPEVHILLGDSDAGTAVNAFRAAVIKAVVSDEQLVAIGGSNGHIRYEGCLSEFASGKTLQARMRLGFTFTYILKPAEL